MPETTPCHHHIRGNKDGDIEITNIIAASAIPARDDGEKSESVDTNRLRRDVLWRAISTFVWRAVSTLSILWDKCELGLHRLLVWTLGPDVVSLNSVDNQADSKAQQRGSNPRHVDRP